MHTPRCTVSARYSVPSTCEIASNQRPSHESELKIVCFTDRHEISALNTGGHPSGDHEDAAQKMKNARGLLASHCNVVVQIGLERARDTRTIVAVAVAIDAAHGHRHA